MANVAVKISNSISAIEDIIIGNSAGIVRLRDMINRVAQSNASVMVAGPSGSGKELVARAIHDASTRNAGPFVPLNCGAIPADLIESELFGHERGSFTGAYARRIGRFEEADKGTLFLDEIGDMRFDMQVKLLRVLEDHRVTRVGGTSTIPVDLRIVSATHQDVDQAMADGRFREDLFFRLGVVLLRVPSLASRVEDIPALITHFQSGRPRGQVARFDDSAIKRLMQHPWPGNVRELRNIIERAGVLFGGQTIDAFDVEQLLGRVFGEVVQVERAPADVVIPLPVTPKADVIRKDAPINLKDMIETMELDRIQTALDLADGVISEAARLLTLKRTTLIEKMRKYGVGV
jgi:sigma-54 dependent transcriptional regulator, flagellar regulatory protein